MNYEKQQLKVTRSLSRKKLSLNLSNSLQNFLSEVQWHASFLESSLSHDHISLLETEGKSSVSEATDSINGHEGIENINASLQFLLNSTSNSSKATNATDVVQPLVHEGIILEVQLFNLFV